MCDLQDRDQTFKLIVSSANKKISESEQRAIRDAILTAHSPVQAVVQLNNPTVSTHVYPSLCVCVWLFWLNIPIYRCFSHHSSS